MRRASFLSFGLLLAGVQPTLAGEPMCSCPEPDSNTVIVTFEKTYSGSYRPGEPYDYVTISPDGNGESLADAGITIHFVAKNGAGEPVAGLPAREILLYSLDLVLCTDWGHADAPTDENGYTTFTGTLNGGGCARGLDVFADGCFMGTVPVNVNSVDVGASAGFVDSSDLDALAARIGDPSAWDICFDFNESGPPTIDCSDLTYFASRLGAACQ